MATIKALKTELQNSLYVMHSTLNQMVNYIPLKLFEFKKENVFNITTDHGNNKKWDDNFQEVTFKFEEENIGEIPHEQILQIDEFKSFLEDKCEKVEDAEKICWNITGGQRPYILAVYDFIKDTEYKTHYLLYLEGNSRKLSVSKFEKGNLVSSFDGKCDELYTIEDLTIEVALNLMGYKPKPLPQNILNQPNERGKLIEFYSKFYPVYRANKGLREVMPDFNSKASGGANFNDIIDNKFPSIQGLTKDEIKTQWDKHKKQKVFGYILEEMLLYLLLKSIEENKLEKYIAGVYHSSKITDGASNNTIDEFDTLILTKTGQIISFEAKSGGMSGDVAKSTNYSTYAISGVYGKPILITPQMDGNDTINDRITKAVRSAKRANLEIWYLEDIGENLKNRLT